MQFMGLGYQRIKEYVAIDLRNNVVIKYCPTKQLESSHASRYQFQHVQAEVSIVPTLDHPHIIKYQNILYDADNTPYAIVMPRAQYDFQDVIEHPQLNVRSLPQHFRKILTAVAYLHERDIVHLDLRSSNVLLLDEEPVLADFGFACKFPYFAQVSDFIGKWIRVKEEWQGPELYEVFDNMSRNVMKKKNVRRLYERGDVEGLPAAIKDKAFEQQYFDAKKHDVFQLGLMLWYWLIFSNHCLCQSQSSPPAAGNRFEAPSTATSNQVGGAPVPGAQLPGGAQHSNRNGNAYANANNNNNNNNSADDVMELEDGRSSNSVQQQVKKETVKVDKQNIFVRCSPYAIAPTRDDETYKLFLEHNYRGIYEHFLADIIKEQWRDEGMHLESMLNLICSCFQIEADKRPTVAQMLQHPWVNV